MDCFYNKNGMIGTIDSSGHDYSLNVVTDHGEYLVRKTGPVSSIVNRLWMLDHQLKTKSDLSKEEFKGITEHFPWMEDCELEVKGLLRGFLSGLFVYAIQSDNRELTEAIIRVGKLDPKGLDARIIKEAVISDADQLPDNDTMDVTLRGDFGRVYCGTWTIGNSRYILREDSWRRISPEIMEKLKQRFCELKRLQRDWQRPEEGFLSMALPHIDVQVAYRKWAGSRPGERKYEVLTLRKETPVFTLKICDANSFLTTFNFEKGLCGNAFNRQYDTLSDDAKKGVRELLASAIRGGDRYMELLVRNFLGESTEEDCEALFREDGEIHLTGEIRKRQIGELEILDTRHLQRTMFSRREKFICKVHIDGQEETIVWYPEEPQHFVMRVYHHTEDCVLSENQIRYFRKMTGAEG